MNIKKVLPTGIFLFFTYLSYSQTVPGTLSYQGILMQADGITPFVDGSHSVEFNFYDVAIGGNLLGIGNRTVSVSTTKGLFTCIIGDGAANNAALPYSVGTQQVFVGIKVDGGTELSPRAQLTTTAYAFQAQSAYTISDDAITNSKLANDAVNTSELVNGSVTLAKLAVDAVDNSKLTNDAVNTSELVNGSVTSAKLADASVATIDLSDGSVTNAKLATGIDAAKLTTGVLPLSALPASTLTGSGTSGNVPFWTGATSFGNDASLFWDNANKRLGLGTPTPQSLVEISGDGSTRKSIRLTQTTANTAWTINNFETTASEGAGNFGINLNGSGNKFLINTGGNIGIGTTTPQSKLHLVNNGLTLRLEGSTYSYMDIFNDGPGTRSAWFGYGGPTSNHLELSNEISGGDFILSTNSTERLRVTTTGNVGIGTPSPGKKLDIVGGDVSIDGTVLNTAGGSDFYITGPASGNIILQPNSSSNAGLAKIGTDGVHYFKKSDGTTNQVIFNNGNVGIGTNSPGTALDVNGSTRATDFQVSQSAFNNGSIELSRAQPFIDFHFNGSAADYTSRIIEGTSGWLTVQANFEVQGNLTPIANNTYDIGNSSQRWRTIYSNNALNTSDRRVKEFIVPLEYGLNEVMRLQPVSFKWKGATDNGKRKLGFIAQDVLPVLSDVVDVPINPNDYLSIAYTDIIPVLVKSIQEQQALIAELKTELTEIKKLLKKNSSNQTASTAQPGKK